MKQTLDEFGVAWVIKPKDPAMPLVRELQKKNFSLIVLPRKTYITGELIDNDTTDLLQLETNFAASDINRVRLLDCCKALRSS